MTTDNRQQLLIVDDDAGLRSQLKWIFDDLEVLTAEDRESAVAAIRRQEPPVVLLDLGLPPDPANAGEGMAALEQILALAPSTKVIVITGNQERENALRAVGLGAYDYCQKPVDPEVLRVIVSRALQLFELEAENRRLAAATPDSLLAGVVGASPQIERVCATIEKIAPSDATVLITGESGTGKEVLARALHALSGHAGGDFVPINCAAIPENLLESELFGYERGAFTGADRQTPGKIEYASGGTLFLDEIGDMPLGLQAKLLRFLQDRSIERIGGRKPIPVDVRVVSATNQDLTAMIEAGSFREDLYFRLGEITVEVPPLRERAGDAALLAQFFLAGAREGGAATRGFSSEAMRAITEHHWPGNVRELQNRIKRAAIMAQGPMIRPEDLDLAEGGDEEAFLNLRGVRNAAEREALIRAVSTAGNNLAKAAELLGVSRPTLYDLLSKHGLK